MEPKQHWKPKRFQERISENSESKQPSNVQEWIFADEFHYGPEIDKRCQCGTRISHVIVIYNPLTDKTLEVGMCCYRKFNPRRWNSKKDYLYNARDMAKTDSQKQFTQDLLNKLSEWGSNLIISQKQAFWLELITRKPWKWSMWETRGVI